MKTSNCACHPCARTVLIFSVSQKNSIYACHPCAEAMQIYPSNQSLHFSVEKKNISDSSALCRDHDNLHCILSVEEKLHCTAGLLRDIRTFGRAVEGISVTNAMGGLSSTCCPPLFMRTAYANDGSCNPRRKTSAMRCLTASSLRARRSASPASVPKASMLLSLERSSRSRAVLPDSFLQQQRCSQCWLEWESNRIEAEHDARPAFPGSAARAPPMHWRALHHVALPVSFHGRHVLWCQPLHRRQAAQERQTELFVSLCQFCLRLVLDGARCIVIEPTCLCHCLGHGLRAGDKISFEDGGGQLPQLCRVD